MIHYVCDTILYIKWKTPVVFTIGKNAGSISMQVFHFVYNCVATIGALRFSAH